MQNIKVSVSEPTGHGRVVPRSDGVVVSCRGPEGCDVCRSEYDLATHGQRLDYEARIGAVTTEIQLPEDLLAACRVAPGGWVVTATDLPNGVIELVSHHGVVASVQARRDGRVVVSLSRPTLDSVSLLVGQVAVVATLSSLDAAVGFGHLDHGMDAVAVRGVLVDDLVVWGRDALRALGQVFGEEFLDLANSELGKGG